MSANFACHGSHLGAVGSSDSPAASARPTCQPAGPLTLVYRVTSLTVDQRSSLSRDRFRRALTKTDGTGKCIQSLAAVASLHIHRSVLKNETFMHRRGDACICPDMRTPCSHSGVPPSRACSFHSRGQVRTLVSISSESPPALLPAASLAHPEVVGSTPPSAALRRQ